MYSEHKRNQSLYTILTTLRQLSVIQMEHLIQLFSSLAIETTDKRMDRIMAYWYNIFTALKYCKGNNKRQSRYIAPFSPVVYPERPTLP